MTRGIAWLSLAATPTFAIMALLAAIQDGAMPGMLCPARPTPRR